MTESVEFELAQKRLKDRQRNQSLLIFWSALFCTTIVINVIFGGIDWFWVPLEIFTVIMAARKALQLYYHAPSRSLRVDLIEQEMSWLFGVDWRDYTDARKYTFAQDRIRRRRLERWGFLLHLLIFVPITAWFIYIDFFFPYGGQGAFCLAMPIIWFIFLVIPHAWRAFPVKGIIARREQKVGAELLLELQRMHPEKLKNEEKPKREIEYTVGDDGELVEIELDELEPKSKREET